MTQLTWHDLQWCLQRTPKSVLTMLRANHGKVFVAGGFIRACVAHEPVNDIDLFVGSKDMGRQLANQLSEQTKKKVHETDNAFTVTGLRMPVQFIHRWTFETPESAISSFDFTIAQAAFWCSLQEQSESSAHQNNWASICNPRFYADLAAKRLIYTSPTREEEAGGSMLRVLKFYQRGYRIPLDSLGAVIARLACAINELKGDYDPTMHDGLSYEQFTAKIITGLLREVDPNIDPSHIAHLPSEPECEQQVPSELV